MVADIRDPEVALASQGSEGFHVAVEGTAGLIHDRAEFAVHGSRDLDRWFEDGVDTAGLVMIKVQATRIHDWDGEDNGELVL